MAILKKIIFGLLFLASISALIYAYKLVLSSYLDVYFKAYGGLYEFGLISILIILASLFFCLFVTFSQSFKYAGPLALLGSLSSFLFLTTNLSMVVGICLFLSLTLVYFNLQTMLKSYITFQPASLLNGPIKLLNTFILFSLAFGYFLNANSIIQTQGFKIPEAIINWSVDLTLRMQGTQDLNLLKQNPDILKQLGINPNDLGSMPQSQNKDSVKVVPSLPGINGRDIMNAQTGNMLDLVLKPYIFAVPFILTVMFYSYPSFILWVISIFLSPIILFIFYLFEKSGFVKFEKEMREVKKMVV